MMWALHGALGQPSDWAGLPNVIAVDLWDDAYGQDALTEWARAFNQHVRERDVEPTLLGYSMGGRLALHALTEAPDLWGGAIIVSAHLGLSDPNERQRRWEHDHNWDTRLRDEPWEKFLHAWDKQPVFGGHTPTAERPFHPAMHRCFNQWSLAKQQNLAPRLHKIRCPVLWIAGEDDRKFVEQGKRAITLLSNARLEVIPACGHRVPWQMDPFSERITAFQSEVKATN